MRKTGSALILVLLFATVFNLLGLALLELVLTEGRINRNVLLYDRLFYYAEAGIEEAVARLPRDYAGFAAYSAVIEREGEPAYRVEVSGENGGKIIRSAGKAEGKSRRLTVKADIRLLGGNAVFALGEVRLGRSAVGGNVHGEGVVFTGGENAVLGSLYAGSVEQQWGASSTVRGRQCPALAGVELCPGFDWLEEEAFFFGGRWHIKEYMGEYIWENVGEEPGPLRIYVAGDMSVEGGFVFDGVAVVRGDLKWRADRAEGAFLLLVEGDILLCSAWEQEAGSGVFYSGGSILDCRADREAVTGARGAFIASGGIELDNVVLEYCEEPLWLCLEALKPGSFAQVASFALEWIDKEPRR